MKLQQFLKENTIGFEYLEKFRDEVSDAIYATEKKLNAKGFKSQNLADTSEPDDETHFNVVFSNKILDVSLELELTPGSNGGDEDISLEIQFSIADGYAVEGGQGRATVINTYRTGKIAPHNEHDLIASCESSINEILSFADKFHDWYLDITGEYGKVKLYVDHSNKSNPYIKALAGEMSVSSGKSTVF